MIRRYKTIKNNSTAAVTKGLAVLLLGCMLLESCSGIPGREQQRNKMPEFNDLSNGFEGSGYSFQGSHINNHKEFGLTLSNVDIGFMGTRQSFISVALPSTADDSVAFNLVNTYGRFALPLLNDWAKRERNGVVLDLREPQQIDARPEKTEFVINVANEGNIPLIFLWSQSSAYRAKAYMKLLDQVTGISYRRLPSN